MSDDDVIAITVVAGGQRSRPRSEICEHRVIGHPDDICDGVAEAVSRRLSRQVCDLRFPPYELFVPPLYRTDLNPCRS